MEHNSDKIRENFNELKSMLLRQASSALGESGLKLFLALLDEYQESLLESLAGYERAVREASDENKMLLGLVGANDTEFRAKLISQAGEIRFLSQEVHILRRSLEEARNRNDAQSLEKERLKGELETSLKAREKDQMEFGNRVRELENGLKSYDEKMKVEMKKIADRETELNARFSGISREIEAGSEQAVRKILVRMNNMCVDIGAASSDLKDEVEKLKLTQGSGGEKKHILSGKPSAGADISQILPNLNLLTEKARETSDLIKKYFEAMAPREIRPAKVNWQRVFEDLRARYAPQASSRKITIAWPSSKMPADFISDQSLITRAFAEVVQNALEALPDAGAVEISISFFGRGGCAVISDSGRELGEEQKEMLFVPFYTTKSSHYGLGLVKAKRHLSAIGGDAVYSPSEGKNAFKLTFGALDKAAPR